ncbi:MAG: sodium:proton antiporter [Candidatus Neomarinimicrobiota bacterium]|nr:sodium:proton antiporter [Candidatus Neomarinimicrobiota bacterium]
MFKYLFVCIALFITPVFASSSELGAKLPLFSIIPFSGLLLSIALFPLILPSFWHKNFGKIAFFWAILFIIPFTAWQGFSIMMHELLHVILLEYIPFVLILFSLYTISGGIKINGSLSGSPQLNVSLIAIGTILASWMGTTGAAMLLIRPLLRANKWRKNKVHTIVFFIFLVANIGGALTPLGDPPLFLGFLQGISFFWTTKALFFPMLIVSLYLLAMYYLIDMHYYKKEDRSNYDISCDEPFSIEGANNIFLLVCVVLAVLMSGLWKPHVYFNFIGIHLELQNMLRDFSLLILGLLSLKITDDQVRNSNGFTWFPIIEVSKLFASIFITIIPVITILKAGNDGVLNVLLTFVTNSDGSPVNSMYFWMTGLLSAFLDNAPTYLVFFNIAGSNVSHNIADFLMNEGRLTLLAISLGAVFMGALSYIGNAPNFMVRSIAEEDGIKMPSFFGYMVLSMILLSPIFFILSLMLF